MTPAGRAVAGPGNPHTLIGDGVLLEMAPRGQVQKIFFPCPRAQRMFASA